MPITKIQDSYVLDRSKFAVHAFSHRDISGFSELLDDDFVYIGSFDSHYSHGKEEFLEVASHEINEGPVDINDEEYFILSHEGSLWNVCGRFTTSSRMDRVSIMYARKRITMVWKEIDNQLKLLHIHCTMARDVPLELNYSADMDDEKNIRWFDYIRKFNSNSLNEEKIMLKDIHGNTRLVFPAEIFYAHSNGHYVTVFTANSSFDIRKSLKELESQLNLFKCHKRYLINPLYVRDIRRYTITLARDFEVPVSKSRYKEIKEYLSKNLR